jgi:hypothetical protein
VVCLQGLKGTLNGTQEGFLFCSGERSAKSA